MKYYHWNYISKNDINLFDEALFKTPYLICHDEEYSVKCNNYINDYQHYHDKYWKINNNIELCHLTDYGKFKLSVKWKRIYLDQEFANFLVNLVNKAHEICKKIKQEGHYGEVNEGEIKSTIHSLVSKWSYNNEISIKEIASDLLYSFAVRHKFRNGNKRTALVTYILFLQFCGLFLWNTNKNEHLYMNYWEPNMINIIEQKHENKKETDIINYINNTFMKNITISYTRHNE